jgi:hypothetical protein
MVMVCATVALPVEFVPTMLKDSTAALDGEVPLRAPVEVFRVNQLGIVEPLAAAHEVAGDPPVWVCVIVTNVESAT